MFVIEYMKPTEDIGKFSQVDPQFQFLQYRIYENKDYTIHDFHNSRCFALQIEFCVRKYKRKVHLIGTQYRD